MLKKTYYLPHASKIVAIASLFLFIMGTFISRVGAASLAENGLNNGPNDAVYYTRNESASSTGFQFVNEVWKDKEGNLLELSKYLPPAGDQPALMPDITVDDKEATGPMKQMFLSGADLQVVDNQTG